MKPATKLSGFAVLLGIALAGGAAAGAAVGPIDVGEPTEHNRDHAEASTMNAPPTTDLPVGGLQVSQDGYSMEPEARELADRFAFTITGPDGEPVTELSTLHERALHLIIASTDLQVYAHLHPELGGQGRWVADLPELAPGAYRAFADFEPAEGEAMTLGVDVSVPGLVRAHDEIRPVAEDTVDGYAAAIEVDHERDVATVTVRRAGEVIVTDPYLGAAGHLVALRDGDLAYLHVHPLGDEPAGPVGFALEVPSSGRYALFFDFSVDGVVRTARFVVDLTPAESAHGGGH